MSAGRFIGGILVVVGAIATGAGLWMLESQSHIYKFMLAGPALGLVGVAMLIFPGGDLQAVDLNDRNASFWGEAPWSHRLVWIAAGCIGAALALVFYLHQVPDTY